jgi:hypothetical protein
MGAIAIGMTGSDVIASSLVDVGEPFFLPVFPEPDESAAAFGSAWRVSGRARIHLSGGWFLLLERFFDTGLSKIQLDYARKT